MAKVDTNPNKIEEILTRGVHEIIIKEELKEKLLSGKQLHLKLGTDVTGAHLHLGHTVIQRKIRDFQELGHKVTLIIGDFTTLVGDHSGKVDKRDYVSPEQIKQDERTYQEQFFKTVIKSQTEIRHNSKWLKKLDFNDVITLAKQFTIAQILDRESFLLRYKENKPIGLDEFLYPLMQGYDSVELMCDVEFGGTDQTFNLLAGRKLMQHFGLQPQISFIMKLLIGSDGRPMGKSLKNFIPITADPNDMYGQIMTIVDNVIFDYFELVTRIPITEIKEMRTAVENGENPMIFKKRLAKEIVAFYHSKKEAEEAEKHFEKTVQRGETPNNIQDIQPSSYQLTAYNLAKSVAQDESGLNIKRVITQGGFRVNDERIFDPNKLLNLKSGDTVKFGKRTYGKIK